MKEIGAVFSEVYAAGARLVILDGGLAVDGEIPDVLRKKVRAHREGLLVALVGDPLEGVGWEDGWPRCPRCGEDKLSGLMDARERSYRPPLPRYFGYAWRCRRCSWEGYVKDPPAWPDDPPPEVTES